MLPERRAVLFDLDDTLYPYRRFKLSGFVAVAQWLSDTYGCDRRGVLRVLARASRGPARGHEIQIGLAALQLPPALAGDLVRILQDHQPALRLPSASLKVLDLLRRDGWKLAIVTNGSPDIQARKIAALGLRSRVDAVVYAAECGSGCGKPEPDAFDAALREINVPAAHAVVVGDSPDTDIAGALAAGMPAIRCAAWTVRRSSDFAQLQRLVPVVHQLSRIPDVARSLLLGVSHRHVA